MIRIYGGILVLLMVYACSESSEEPVDKRAAEDQVASVDSNTDLNTGAPPEPTQNPSQIDSNVLSFSAVTLNLAQNSELVGDEFLSNIRLVSRVDETTTVIFNKDGSSWNYGAEGTTGPVEISAFISQPDDAELYSMDGNDFWMVSSEKISKRKIDPEANPNEVTLINFAADKLSGTTDGMRVLGATHQTLVLYMTTHIVIFSVIDNQPAAYEFVSKLPSGLGENLISAGDLAQGGYWIATDSNFATIRMVDNSWQWNVVEFPTNLESYTSIAARFDFESMAAVGDVVAVSTSIYSTSGAPIAAASE